MSTHRVPPGDREVTPWGPPALPLPEAPPPPDPGPLGAQVGRWFLWALFVLATPAWACWWGEGGLTGTVPWEVAIIGGLGGTAALAVAVVVIGVPLWATIHHHQQWRAAATHHTTTLPLVWAALIDSRDAWLAAQGRTAPPVEQEIWQVEVDSAGRPTGQVKRSSRSFTPTDPTADWADRGRVIDGEDVSEPPPSTVAEAIHHRITRWLAGDPTVPLTGHRPVAYTADMRAIVEVGMVRTPSVRACCGDPPRPFRSTERARYQLARDTLYAYGLLRRTSSGSYELVHGLVPHQGTIEQVHARVAAILAQAPALDA